LREAEKSASANESISFRPNSEHASIVLQIGVDTMDQLIAEGLLRVAPAALAALAPPPALGAVPWEHIEGMLLGLAIGDALGNTTEGQLPGARQPIGSYLPNRYAGGRRVGLPSDDTQLAFWTLEHLLEHGRVVPERLLATFASRQIFGIGSTVRAACRAFRDGRPWYEAGQHSAANGALMRIAPVVVPHLESPSSALWEDAVLAGAITHNDATSIAACVAFVGILWELLAMPAVPQPAWWLDAYVARARLLEGETELRPRHPGLAFRGPLWRFVDTEVRRALEEQLSVRDACQRWYSGAFLLETVPSALYILARHCGEPETAILRAVNDIKDNDTIAAIVGAAVGALHGRGAFPSEWLDGLLGRTTADDDGRVFELIAQAREQWG
jgi:ADP-ribosylglycohydrolase